MMNKRIQTYAAETAVLQQKIHTILEQDGRIVAAWLFGSKGRGESDALSDIDVWVIVEDEAYEAVVAQKRAFVQQMGTAVFFLEAPHNAPPNGAYLAVQFDAPTAPHHVDWYWQPRAAAVRPPETKPLFDKGNIPSAPDPITFPGGELNPALMNQPNHFISYFWMMLMVSAKQIWRQPDAEGIPYLQYFIGDFHKSQRLLRLPTTHLETAALPTKAAKIDYLLELADEMKMMMEMLDGLGTAVPHAIVPGAYRFLEMVSD
ncbi:nucleotidyltransferase domain-containing protein [Candidatus Leptofilum sp.]|uniref:nucleotidyltransferase domain-containing protein n=1 Tax=Candidatus Leptofilum sp. TaxID=3241576 RepID=UPI003B5C174A